MTRFRLESGERGADTNMTAVTGDLASAVLAVSLLLIGLIGIPEARIFFHGSGVFGGLLGMLLWWKLLEPADDSSQA